MISAATHYDHLEQIGRTAFSAEDYVHRRWCRYFFHRLTETVSSLLGDVEDRATVLDMGCSHGSWHDTWRKMGFAGVHGVELHSGRAQLAREAGFDHVYTCDAAAVPAEDESYGVVCSNGVFVHILRREDQIAVIREAYRLVRPGGVFLLNFPPPVAYGHHEEKVVEHCVYHKLDTMLRSIVENTGFEVEDLRPTFYRKCSLYRRVLHRFLWLPGTITALNWDDRRRNGRLPLQESATVYIKMRKPRG